MNKTIYKNMGKTWIMVLNSLVSAKKGDKIEIFRLENRSEKLESGKGIGKGKAISVQIDKKDVKKGKKGDEVGISYEGDVIVQKGDIIAAYEIREKKLGLEE